MSEIKERIKEAVEETDEDYEMVELSVNRGTVDAYVDTNADKSDLKDQVEEEFSDVMVIGLDVQNEAVEDFDELVKHINFSYRD